MELIGKYIGKYIVKRIIIKKNLKVNIKYILLIIMNTNQNIHQNIHQNIENNHSNSPLTATLKSVGLSDSNLTESVYLDDSQDLDLNNSTETVNTENTMNTMNNSLYDSYDFTDNNSLNLITFDYDDINQQILKFKMKLSGLSNVKEGQKVWIDNNILSIDESEYYITHIFQSVNRYMNNQGREQLFHYIDYQFTEFIKLLDLCKSAFEYNINDVRIVGSNNDAELFIDKLIPGLDNLKKTYHDHENLVAKISSIILTFIDYKDFLEKQRETIQKQKNKSTELTKQIVNNEGLKNRNGVYYPPSNLRNMRNTNIRIRKKSF